MFRVVERRVQILGLFLPFLLMCSVSFTRISGTPIQTLNRSVRSVVTRWCIYFRSPAIAPQLCCCGLRPPLRHSPMLGTNRCASIRAYLGKSTNCMADLPSLLVISQDDWSYELSRHPTQKRPPHCRPNNVSALLRRTCMFSQENCTVYRRQLTSNVTCQLCATISASKRSSSITGKVNRSSTSPETSE